MHPPPTLGSQVSGCALVAGLCAKLNVILVRGVDAAKYHVQNAILSNLTGGFVARGLFALLVGCGARGQRLAHRVQGNRIHDQL